VLHWCLQFWVEEVPILHQGWPLLFRWPGGREAHGLQDMTCEHVHFHPSFFHSDHHLCFVVLVLCPRFLCCVRLCAWQRTIAVYWEEMREELESLDATLEDFLWAVQVMLLKEFKASHTGGWKALPFRWSMS
jgi:hypothetical protein